jgi:hypothetical protein
VEAPAGEYGGVAASSNAAAVRITGTRYHPRTERDPASTGQEPIDRIMVLPLLYGLGAKDYLEQRGFIVISLQKWYLFVSFFLFYY